MNTNTNQRLSILAAAAAAFAALAGTTASAFDGTGSSGGGAVTYSNGRLVPGDSYFSKAAPRPSRKIRALEFNKFPGLEDEINRVLNFLDRRGMIFEESQDKDAPNERAGQISQFFRPVTMLLVDRLNCADSWEEMTDGRTPINAACVKTVITKDSSGNRSISYEMEFDEGLFSQLTVRDKALLVVHEYFHVSTELTHDDICPILGSARTLLAVADRQSADLRQGKHPAPISNEEYETSVGLQNRISSLWSRDKVFAVEDRDFVFKSEPRVNRQGGGLVFEELPTVSKEIPAIDSYVSADSVLMISRRVSSSSEILVNSEILLEFGVFSQNSYDGSIALITHNDGTICSGASFNGIQRFRKYSGPHGGVDSLHAKSLTCDGRPANKD